MTEQVKKNRVWRRLLLLPLLLLLFACLSACGGKKGSGQRPGEPVTAQAPQVQSGEEAANPRDRESLAYSGREEEGNPDDSGEDPGEASEEDAEEDDDPDSGGIFENGIYTTAEDVALYLHTYGKLPLNFMTKKEARARGWTRGSLEKYAPGMCIGGDRFGNYEGVLPKGNYHECDINTLGADARGPERLVYSDDGRIYYTNDHYETFQLLYGGK